MKSHRSIVSIVVAGWLAMSGAALAHDECDDDEIPRGHHAAKPAQVAAPARPASAQIAVKLFQYQPGKTQVKAGATVTWINEDEIYHSITADKNSFAAALDGKGKSFSFTFDQPGLYSYFCDRHEHMRGEIEVN